MIWLVLFVAGFGSFMAIERCNIEHEYSIARDMDRAFRNPPLISPIAIAVHARNAKVDRHARSRGCTCVGHPQETCPWHGGQP